MDFFRIPRMRTLQATRFQALDELQVQESGFIQTPSLPRVTIHITISSTQSAMTMSAHPLPRSDGHDDSFQPSAVRNSCPTPPNIHSSAFS